VALTPRPTAAAPVAAVTGRVTRADASGVWVTPLGHDQAHPLGPCRGLTPPAGAIACLVLTQEKPWVVAFEEVQ
jgi:hypothetical protein